ncbi:hypothetical protein GO730_31165 [Spirosoma sp. HMF3257]|uniref:Uncharacterized protein n=1 Tax=Spirosoma telluris TaxID=2183553 RepID=A0A327NS75_9BACT|nr:hypothetical protein [Spirosoma telluris]RAI77503.1 hypothetical protein HMF3257_31060 [Spirosoma telluris]
MTNLIGLGDGSYVTHNDINGGLRMTGKEVDTVANKAQCVLTDGKERWILIDHLTLMKEAPNGHDI